MQYNTLKAQFEELPSSYRREQWKSIDNGLCSSSHRIFVLVHRRFSIFITCQVSLIKWHKNITQAITWHSLVWCFGHCRCMSTVEWLRVYMQQFLLYLDRIEHRFLAGAALYSLTSMHTQTLPGSLRNLYLLFSGTTGHCCVAYETYI